MNSLLHLCSSSAAIFSKTSHFVSRNSLYGFSCSSWKRNIEHDGITTTKFNFLLARFRVQCYSTRRGRRASPAPVSDPIPMEQEKDAFYVVRKGDVVGVYKTLDDCQAQVGSSVCDPSMSVYKGYSFPKEAEEYLVSRGLKNALYSIHAVDVRDDIFGPLLPCPFQQPASYVGKASEVDYPQERSQEVLESDISTEAVESTFSTDPLREHLKLDHSVEIQADSSKCDWCILEFDGASKGNPGQSGAGAVLRPGDGNVVYRLYEGVGVTTNNVAEYRALLLGLKYALKKGFKRIIVRGDSKLICLQVQGQWRTRHKNLVNLCKEAKKLRDEFLSFQITHFLREFNAEADVQANLAVYLKDGEVQEVCEKMYSLNS